MDDPENEQSWKPPTISCTPSEASTPPHRAVYASQRARLMLGCYRRGDANDPDTYVAAIAAVLATFDAGIIREATDPRTGIQSTEKFAGFMPNAGEVKSFCNSLASHKDRITHYQQLPPPERAARKVVAPDPSPDPQTGRHPAGTVLADFDEALKLYGRPIAAFEDGRRKPYGTR